MSTPTVHLLPSALDIAFVKRGFPVGGWTVPPGGDRLQVSCAHLPPSHAEPIALVTLAAWAEECRARGIRVECAETLKSPYLYRTGLLRALAAGAPRIAEVEGAENWIPLCTFRTRDEAERRVGELVLRHLERVPPTLAQAIGVTLREIGINAVEHGRGPRGAMFAASWFPVTRRLTFAFADAGPSIPGTIAKKGLLAPGETDADAVEKALEYRVTGALDPGTTGNQGLGLYWTRCYVRSCAGRLVIRSAQAWLDESGSAPALPVVEGARWGGTILEVTFRVDEFGRHAAPPLPVEITSAPFPIRFGDAPHPQLLLRPPVDRAGFGGTKEWFASHSVSVREALASGGQVQVDFGGASFGIQGGVSALLTPALLELGEDGASRVWVRGGGAQLLDVLRVAVVAALRDRQAIAGGDGA